MGSILWISIIGLTFCQKAAQKLPDGGAFVAHLVLLQKGDGSWRHCCVALDVCVQETWKKCSFSTEMETFVARLFQRQASEFLTACFY